MAAPPFEILWWPLLADNASGSAIRKDNLDYSAGSSKQHDSGLDDSGSETADGSDFSHATDAYGSGSNVDSSGNNPADIFGWQFRSDRDAGSVQKAKGSLNKSTDMARKTGSKHADQSKGKNRSPQSRDESTADVQNSSAKGMHGSLNEATKPVDLRKVIEDQSFSDSSGSSSDFMKADKSQQKPNLSNSGVLKGSMGNSSFEATKHSTGKIKPTSENISAADNHKETQGKIGETKKRSKGLSNVEQSQRELDELLSGVDKVSHSGTNMPKGKKFAKVLAVSGKLQKNVPEIKEKNIVKRADKALSSKDIKYFMQQGYIEWEKACSGLNFSFSSLSNFDLNFNICGKTKAPANADAKVFSSHLHFKHSTLSQPRPVGSSGSNNQTAYSLLLTASNELQTVSRMLHLAYSLMLKANNKGLSFDKIYQTAISLLQKANSLLHSASSCLLRAHSLMQRASNEVSGYDKVSQTAISLLQSACSKLQSASSLVQRAYNMGTGAPDKTGSRVDIWCSGKLAEIVLNPSTQNSAAKYPEFPSLNTKLNNKKTNNLQKNSQKNYHQINQKNSNFNPKQAQKNPKQAKQKTRKLSTG